LNDSDLVPQVNVSKVIQPGKRENLL